MLKDDNVNTDNNIDNNVDNNIYKYNNLDIKNVGFIKIANLFYKNGWKIIKNDEKRLIYNKEIFECDLFEILEIGERIYVTIPIKNSVYQFKTHFDSYDKAFQYVEIQMNKYFV